MERDGTLRERQTSRAAPLVEFKLSPAQWAAMITSFGMGEGVPCTLEYVRDGSVKHMPDIMPIESTRQRFDRQIREASERQIQKISENVNELGALLAGGTVSKKALRDLHNSLESAVNNLPANLEFSTTLMQESMDNIVASGKAELEATALGVAQRLGLKEISRLVELENKSGEDDGN